MNKNLKDFLSFAYQLRKHDTENKYTRKLLAGRVQPELFVDIIAANKWDPARECMMPEDDAPTFTIQKDGSYHLMYPQPEAVIQWPVISRLDMMEGGGFSNKFNFILKEDGAGFGIEYDGKRLVAADEQPVDQGSSTFLEWVDLHHDNYHRENCSVWHLQPHLMMNTKKYKFVLSLRYGEKQPRLLPNVLNPPFYSKLLASTNMRDGYGQEAYVMWDIKKSQ